MKRVMVRYQVKADRIVEHEGYIARVFEALHAAAPAGLRYASLKLDDGVSFVHLASLETDDGSNPLRDLPAFQKFTAGIHDRCDVQPVTTQWTEVGSYGF